MLAEAAALITLHCSTEVSYLRQNPAMGKVPFTVTLDYNRNYAYLDGDKRIFDQPFEVSGVDVTPGQISFPRRSNEAVILNGGTISRTDGAVNITFESAFFKDGRGQYRPSMTLQGQCSPGPLVQPPTSIF